MKNREEQLMKMFQKILWIVMVAVLLFLIIGEIMLPPEGGYGEKNARLFETEWKRVLADGSTQEVEIPGVCKAEREELVRIECTLPQVIEDRWMCFRASRQDVCVYVGDELRVEYSTKDTRPFGTNSASAYVFAPIYPEDAGKVLAFECVTDSMYTGVLNDIYIGEKHDICEMFLGQYTLIIVVSMFMLMLSIITIMYSGILHAVYKMKMEISYLGWGLLLAALWLFTNSRIRQFFLPNGSVASAVGLMVVMLLPYPYLAYVNQVQKHRYAKLYILIAGLTVVNFGVSTCLQVMNVIDLLDIMLSSHVVIGLLVLVCAVTMILDVKNGKISEYKEVGIGFIGLMISAVWEIYLVYQPISTYSGLALCIGLSFLLATAALKTGRDRMALEKQKDVAVLAGESKAKFLANMSHEIRTPINTVLGMNEMILRENKDATVREYAENINNAGQLLLGLINDILDFSKIEAGKMDIIVTDYHMSKMLTGVIQGLRYKSERSNLEILFDIDENLPSILRGDEIRIRQILNNLLANAVKYTKEGSITLAVRGEYVVNGYEVYMSVTDTGIGIRKEDIPYLFDSFQRMEEKKNRHIEGTGLGLSITQQLIELMNGSINVKSEYGKGSCFSVRIPQQVVDGAPMGKLEEAYKRDNAKQAESAQEEFKMTLYAPKVRILAVDDTKMNLFVVKALLKRTAIQLDLASGGNECLELCRNNTYDLILMDHMMPEPDGIETLHLLRKEENNPNQKTKVVVLTANAISGVREKYIEDGFQDYLSKPLLGEDLEQMLKKHLPKDKLEKSPEQIAYEDKVAKEQAEKVMSDAIAKTAAMFGERNAEGETNG